VIVKQLLLDFDGVIRHWPVDNADVEEKHGLPKNSLFEIAFSKPLFHPAILGEITDELWRENISQTLSDQYPDSNAKQAVLEWSESIGVIDIDLLRWLRSFEAVELSLVTNATSRLDSDMSMLGIVDYFGYIFNSSVLGIIKPDPQYYVKVLTCLKATPEEVVYIDDNEENVEIARNLGIVSYHFVTAEALREYLPSVLQR